MRETLAQHAWLGVALLCVALVLLLALAYRRRRRKAPSGAEVPPRGLDPAALAAELAAAEACGDQKRLPALYLSLATLRIEAGLASEAEQLLRKCLRGTGGRDQREAHARARLALGDLAQAGGDLTSACEHWQIARGLFRELNRSGDHDAVEARMRANGCPTDWVLTDF